MLAGLSHARGEAVAIIDADLQHPPQLLAQMLPLLDQGYEQVVARRTRTGDPAVRTALSRTYYRMINRLVDVAPRGRGRRLPGDEPQRRPRAAGAGRVQPVLQGPVLLDRLHHGGGRLRERLPRGRARPSGGCATCSTTASTGPVVQHPAAAAGDLLRRAGRRRHLRVRRVGALGRDRARQRRCPATSPRSASWSASAASRWCCWASSASTSAGSTPRPSTGRTSWSGRAATARHRRDRAARPGARAAPPAREAGE